MQKKLVRKRKDTTSTTEGQPLILCHWDVKGKWHDFREVRWSVGNLLQRHPQRPNASCATEKQKRGQPLSLFRGTKGLCHDTTVLFVQGIRVCQRNLWLGSPTSMADPFIGTLKLMVILVSRKRHFKRCRKEWARIKKNKRRRSAV